MRAKANLVVGLAFFIVQALATGTVSAAPGYVVTVEQSAIPVPQEIREMEAGLAALAAARGAPASEPMKDAPPFRLVTHVSPDGFRAEDPDGAVIVSRSAGGMRAYMLDKGSQTYENPLFVMTALAMGVSMFLECADTGGDLPSPTMPRAVCCWPRDGFLTPTKEFKQVGGWRAEKIIVKVGFGDDGSAYLATTTGWYTKDWRDLVEAERMVLELTVRALASMTDELAGSLGEDEQPEPDTVRSGRRSGEQDDGNRRKVTKAHVEEETSDEEPDSEGIDLPPLVNSPTRCDKENTWKSSPVEAYLDGIRDLVNTYGTAVMSDGPTQTFLNITMEGGSRVVSVEKREIPSSLFTLPKGFTPKDGSGEPKPKTPQPAKPKKTQPGPK